MRDGQKCGKAEGHKPSKSGNPDHLSEAAYARLIERTHARDVQRRAGESTCAAKNCENIAPPGYVRCRNCNREATRRWAKENPERARESVRRWDKENPERKRETVRHWEKENPERKRELDRRYRATPEGRESLREGNRRRRERKAEASYEDLTRQEIYDRDNGCCYICGIALTPEAAEVEHVIPLAKFSDFADDCEDEPMSGLRLSCLDCNRGQGGKHDRDPAEYALWRWRSGMPLVQAPLEAI